MPEASTIQGTLKRLIEAEEQARRILKAAEEGAHEAIAQAREQARQSIDAVRQEAANRLQAGLNDADSKAATKMKRRMEQALADAREDRAPG